MGLCPSKQAADLCSAFETAAEVTVSNADDVLCRMNAGTSRVYLSTGRDGQGFSEVYRRACERIAADPKTPKYAAVDIILWLSLTDPQIMSLKPGTLMVNILDRDDEQISKCWKCIAIVAISEGMHGYPKDAVRDFQTAASVVARDTGSVPKWLQASIETARTEAAKEDR